MHIPQALAEEWRHEPEWLAELPSLAARCAERWDLELEEPVRTPHSLVIPAGDAVLKLNAPSHFEADHEADALVLWDGGGAVRLLEHDEEQRALLLERCRPGTRLWDADVDEASAVVELLPRLQVRLRGRHPFRRLSDEAARWAAEVPRRYEADGRPFERSLVELACDVFDSVDPRASFLANQDLHGGNVLRAEREPWLVIDPKPLVGERELDGVGLLRNAALRGGSSACVRWLDALQDLGLDRERLRCWGIAHALAWGWDAEHGWSQRSIEVARTVAASAP